MTAQPELTTGELIAVESQPATISVNFDEAKKQLQADIAKYDTVVTSDTVADAKKTATEINKIKQDLGKREKAAVDAVSAPINAFKKQMKELKQICEDGRQGILTQVAKFEKETLNKAEKKLGELRDSLRDEWSIDAEYHKAEFDDLIKLTALTTKGNLAKAAKDTLTQRVRDEKYQQERVEKRLLMLENASYKAGLKAPLTRAHVESFLFLDDEQYQQRLDAMLESELQREKVAEERHRARFQEEQDRKEAEAKAEAEQQAEQPASEAEQIRQAMAQISEKLRYEDNPQAIRELNEKHMALELELAELIPPAPERIEQIKSVIRYHEKSFGPNTPDWSRKINKAGAERMRRHLTELTGEVYQPEQSAQVQTEEPAQYATGNPDMLPTRIAPLSQPDSGKTANATLAQAETYCLSKAEAWGVWRNETLVCICYQGQVFRPDAQQHQHAA